ncbi:hypothetical protein GF342_04790 [Candidatus Woesearchaeota archaeon]|nr:hypothetical protein [Candidatus Woesearchaeota archaeon]
MGLVLLSSILFGLLVRHLLVQRKHARASWILYAIILLIWLSTGSILLWILGLLFAILPMLETWAYVKRSPKRIDRSATFLALLHTSVILLTLAGVWLLILAYVILPLLGPLPLWVLFLLLSTLALSVLPVRVIIKYVMKKADVYDKKAFYYQKAPFRWLNRLVRRSDITTGVALSVFVFMVLFIGMLAIQGLAITSLVTQFNTQQLKHEQEQRALADELWFDNSALQETTLARELLARRANKDDQLKQVPLTVKNIYSDNWVVHYTNAVTHYFDIIVDTHVLSSMATTASKEWGDLQEGPPYRDGSLTLPDYEQSLQQTIATLQPLLITEEFTFTPQKADKGTTIAQHAFGTIIEETVIFGYMQQWEERIAQKVHDVTTDYPFHVLNTMDEAETIEERIVRLRIRRDELVEQTLRQCVHADCKYNIISAAKDSMFCARLPAEEMPFCVEEFTQREKDCQQFSHNQELMETCTRSFTTTSAENP